MLVLVGVCHEDQLQEDAEYIARKMLNMRIFPSIPSLEGSIKPTDTPQTSVNEGESVEGRRWEKSAKELGLEILCVSQVRVIPGRGGVSNHLKPIFSSPSTPSSKETASTSTERCPERTPNASTPTFSPSYASNTAPKGTLA